VFINAPEGAIRGSERVTGKPEANFPIADYSLGVACVHLRAACSIRMTRSSANAAPKDEAQGV